MIFESLSSEKPKNTVCVKIEKKKFSFRAGYLPQGIPLQLIGYLPEEPSFLPWHAASRALYQLDKLLDRTEEYSLFSVICHLVNLLSNLKNVNLKNEKKKTVFFLLQDYVLKQVAARYHQMGWPTNGGSNEGNVMQASYQTEYES